MADITMCSTKNCTFASKCYRKTAPINPYWQSYTSFKVLDKCDHFWPTEAKETMPNATR